MSCTPTCSGGPCSDHTHQSESVSHSVMSNPLRPQGQWPARLLCPWDSPGKTSGVGCHSLLQGIFLTQGLNLHFFASQADSSPAEPITLNTHAKAPCQKQPAWGARGSKEERCVWRKALRVFRGSWWEWGAPATPSPPTSLQYLVTARPRGCSLLASAVPTTASTFRRGSVATSTSRRTRETLGTPWVIVPVLSNITVFICQKQPHLSDQTQMGLSEPSQAQGRTSPDPPQAGNNTPARPVTESSTPIPRVNLSCYKKQLPLWPVLKKLHRSSDSGVPGGGMVPSPNSHTMQASPRVTSGGPPWGPALLPVHPARPSTLFLACVSAKAYGEQHSPAPGSRKGDKVSIGSWIYLWVFYSFPLIYISVFSVPWP